MDPIHHKEAEDHAVLAFRSDDPVVENRVASGAWKLFFNADLLRKGTAVPTELYDLRTDPREQKNLIKESVHRPLITELSKRASTLRNVGGHRLAATAAATSVHFSWLPLSDRSTEPMPEDSTAAEDSTHHHETGTHRTPTSPCLPTPAHASIKRFRL